jgi:ATP-dependent helicase/nuclease subunit A
MGGDAALRWLMDCARARDLWIGPGAWMPPLDARVRQLLGLPADADEELVAALCADDTFDVRSLRAAMIANQQWKGKTGEKNANTIGDWLAADEAAARRVSTICGAPSSRKRASRVPRPVWKRSTPITPPMCCAWAKASRKCVRPRRWLPWPNGSPRR